MRAKITEGKIEYLPASVKYYNPETKKTKTYKPALNAPSEVLDALGWKEIEYATAPECDETHTLKEVITETEDKIIIGYELVEITDTDSNTKLFALEKRKQDLTEKAIDVLGDCLYGATSTTKLTTQIKENADAMAVIKERKEVQVQIDALANEGAATE